MQDKAQWFKRKTAIVKVHMLLLAHMDRVDIPPILHKDLEFVLKKSSVLLEEIVKIANIPRYTPYGWLTPTIGAVEMLQCLTQAVSIGSRKSFTQGKVNPHMTRLLWNCGMTARSPWIELDCLQTLDAADVSMD